MNYLDLVSLGTVCDVVPLIGLNRAIVSQGLEVLKNKLNLWIKKLLKMFVELKAISQLIIWVMLLDLE